MKTDLVQTDGTQSSGIRSGGVKKNRARNDLAKPKVALVEDNADVRLIVSTLLEEAFSVSEFEDGSSALSSFADCTPDLVVLDLSLPGMSGDDVLASMRRHRLLRDVPVVALTAHTLPGDRERCLALGFDDYVAKPVFDEQDLIPKLQRLLTDRRVGRIRAEASTGTQGTVAGHSQ